tara:strand:+ start:888 stop:1721 length:834 start_codon:yes stop_codon:yes gene_type:complete
MKDQLKYFNRQYPLVDEIVMIRIDSIGEACVNVTLMEYDIEGIIIFKELWNKRLRKRNLRQAAPIGKTMPAQVMMAEEATGNNVITLTKKRITPDEIKDFSAIFSKNKQVISFIENITHTNEVKFDTLLEKIVHPLNEKYIECDEPEYESILDLLEKANQEEDYEFLNDLEVSEEIKQSLIDLVQKKFKPTIEKISAKIALLSSSHLGVNVIKNVLMKSEKENKDFNYYLDKTPYFNIEITTDQPHIYKKKLGKIIDKIQKDMSENEGQFKLIDKSF